MLRSKVGFSQKSKTCLGSVLKDLGTHWYTVILGWCIRDLFTAARAVTATNKNSDKQNSYCQQSFRRQAEVGQARLPVCIFSLLLTNIARSNKLAWKVIPFANRNPHPYTVFVAAKTVWFIRCPICIIKIGTI